MDLSELDRQIQYLNTSGGFGGALDYEKIAEVATNVPEATTEKLLKDLEENRDKVKAPTAWLTSALRKAAGGGGGGGRGSSRPPAWGGGGGGSVEDGDKSLRKRIGWLNGDGGGFQGGLIYDKIVAASGGLPYAEVMRVLKDLEDKKDQVKEPNSWVCAALRKAGGGGAAPTAAPMAWGGPPQQHWGGPGAASGGWGSHGGYAAPMSASNPMDAEKIRKRVDWLNSKGGFAGALTHAKVAEAAAGVPVADVLKVLKDVEEKHDTVKNPLAYVTAALRKAGGGAGGGGGGGHPMPAMAWGGPPAAPGGWAPDAVTEDQKLRKRIGWLNGQGGFGGAIVYDKILQAAGGLEFTEVFRQLQQLEEKKDSVKDPTAWVCNGLRRSAEKNNGGGMPAMAPAPWAGNGGWAPSGQAWGGGGAAAFGGPMDYGYGGPMPMDYGGDKESTSKLHKRMTWLNGKGGFADALNIEKVLEAAAGIDSISALKILKDLEEKKDTVKDPTAYVAAALRKAGGGGGGKGGKSAGKGGMPGVRRTISKH